MEEFKNGAISEEALDEIAGGLKLNSSTVKKVLMGAGVAVLAAASGVGGAMGMEEYMKSRKKQRTLVVPAAPQGNISSNIVPQKKEPVEVESKKGEYVPADILIYPHPFN